MIIVNKIILFLLLLCTSSVMAQTYEKHYFKGKLNNKIPVEIAWYTTLNDGDWVTMGYIYYPNAKNPAPILIVGESTKISPKEPNYDNLDGLKFTRNISPTAPSRDASPSCGTRWRATAPSTKARGRTLQRVSRCP